MPWIKIRNDQPPYKEVSNSGECPKFHKMATLTGRYYGRKTAKTDHNLTYSLSGYSCTLLADTGENGLCSWASQCPLMIEKYL